MALWTSAAPPNKIKNP